MISYRLPCALIATLLFSSPLVLAEEDAGLDIDAQPLDSALREFAEQTGLQIMYSAEIGEGVDSQGANEAETPIEALDHLLADTGLQYRFINERTIAIQTVAAEDATTEPGKSQPASSQVLMAQNQTSAQQTPANVNSETTNDKKDENVVPLDEIIVLGSHIRGIGTSVGSKLIVISREDIAKTGFATAQGVIQSLPQNYGGGPNEIGSGPEASSNISNGSSVNLRGLGSSATLTLVNGRRLPVAGTKSNFVDISTIPTSAIERIEVLADGASAIYGSDAIGGVVNIVLRDNFEGAETELRYGDVTAGSSEEIRFAQTFGKNWKTGNAMVSYEYYNRDALASNERSFLSFDLSPFGGDDFSSPRNVPGNLMDGLNGFRTVFLAIPPGQDGTSLTFADLLPASAANLNDGQEAVELLPDQERHSVFATISQQLGERTELSAEGRYIERDVQQLQGGERTLLLIPGGNPFLIDAQGFGFDVMAYNFLNDLGPTTAIGTQKSYSGLLGLTTELGRDWQLKMYGASSKEEATNTTINVSDSAAVAAALADTAAATSFNPYGDGSGNNPATVDSFRTTRASETTSKLWAADAVVDGTLFDVAGGGAKLAVGVNYREETFNSIVPFGSGTRASPELTREVAAVFSELFVPIVSEQNSRPGIESLLFTAAVRYEDYSGDLDISTTNPKLGLLWAPSKGLNFRGTWGTSFRAPNLADLNTTANFFNIVSRTDPMSPTGRTFAMGLFGADPNLVEETATTWSLGFDFAPESLPGFELNLSYFDIDFEDRIADVVDSANILLNEDLYGSRIMRMPTQADLDVYCLDPQFVGNPVRCDPTITTVIIDNRRSNDASTLVSGLDFTVAYEFDTDKLGHFGLRLNGNYMIEFKKGLTPSDTPLDQVGTVENPVDLVLRNSIDWRNDKGLSATAYFNYTDGYTDVLNVPERKIDSWTTVDLTVAFDTGADGSRLVNDLRIALSVANLFDEDPPFVNRPGRGFDAANANLLGRFISLNASKKW